MIRRQDRDIAVAVHGDYERLRTGNIRRFSVRTRSPPAAGQATHRKRLAKILEAPVKRSGLSSTSNVLTGSSLRRHQIFAQAVERALSDGQNLPPRRRAAGADTQLLAQVRRYVPCRGSVLSLVEK